MGAKGSGNLLYFSGWVGGWSAESKIRQSSALLGLGAGPDLGKKQGLSQYSEAATINKLSDQSN